MKNCIGIENNKILFYDLELYGHHVEFLYHLILYKFYHDASGKELFFVMHPDTRKQLSLLDLPENLDNINGIVVIHPEKSEIERLENETSLFKKAFIEFEIIDRIVKVIRPKICFIMHLNIFQFVIGTKFGKSTPCIIRGILFNPMGANEINMPIWFTKFRKFIQLSWMMRNNKLDHIFILNNHEMACLLNKSCKKKDFFVSVPDPILVINNKISSKSCFFRYSSRIHFLLFGALSRRKGVFVLLDALKKLPQAKAKNIEVLIAGKVDTESTRKELRMNIDLLKDSRPELAVRHLDDFIQYKDIPQIFSEADCILLPYVGNESSSGVLGHAALYEKPVLAAESGLLGKLVKEYKLGVTLDSMDSVILSKSIADFQVNLEKSENYGFQNFIQEHHPLIFSKKILRGA